MPGLRELKKEKKRRHGRLIPLLLGIGLLLWVPAELYLSNNLPRAESVTVRSPRLPDGFDGFRVLHLSDLHEKTFGKGNKTLLKLARDAEPNIIALTGDLLHTPEGLGYAEALLPELAKIAPVYFVTGNHEWAADGKTAKLGKDRLINRLRAVLENCGGIWLDDAFLELEHGGSSIVIAGMSDPNGPYAPAEAYPVPLMAKIVAAYDGDVPFTLLLSHRYDLVGEYAAAGFDAALAGHAHGGLIRLPFTDGVIGPSHDWFPKGTSGVVRAGGTSVAVSRGLGDTGFPRFLNRPQVLTVTLRK